MEGTLAEIRLFGGNFPPRAWSFCEGQLLPINQNQALFSLLGTTFGGDGRTTFGLPDLRGRRAIHPGHGPGLNPIQLGQKGGAVYQTMTEAIMPAHSHDIGGSIRGAVRPRVFNDEATSEEPGDGYYALTEDGVSIYSSISADAYMGAAETSVTTDIQLANQGGQQQFYKQALWEAIYYIICVQGTFPSRN